MASTSATSRVVIVNAELPAHTLSRIGAASPNLRLVAKSELLARPAWLDEAEVLFTQHTDPGRIEHSPSIRWVQTYGAGVEWLLTPAIVAKEELRITNASGIHAQPIAEHVFGLILAFARKLHTAERQQTASHWDQAPFRAGLRTLEGTTLGVLGLGAIGRRVAELGAAFGMHVVGWRRRAEAVPSVAHVYRERELPALLERSDYLVNTLPLTAVTRGLLGRREFAMMRKSAFLVNIGRGATIDTEALVAALTSGQIAGAGLDVTEPEPLPREHPLWQLENVLITPHYSGAHPGYEERVTSIFVDNLQRYAAGRPLVNLVDKQAGY